MSIKYLSQKSDWLIKIREYVGNEEGVRTRSKAESQPYQWTTITVLVKIFKLIINELSNDIEAVAAGHDTDVSDNKE